MEYIKLDELVDIYLGITHTPKYVEIGIPFLSVKDISNGTIDFSNCKYISKEEFDSCPNGAKPKPGDLLFCRVGTIGKPILIGDNIPLFASFVSLGFFRRKLNIQVNLNFLKYWMDSSLFYNQVKKNVKGASQVNLNTGWLKKFNVPKYSFSEQQEIVTVLDKINEIIDADKKQLELLDEAVKSRFIEMFGDPMLNNKGYKIKTYGDLFELNAGGTPSKTKKEYWDNGTISWIGSNLCQNVILYENDGRYITQEGYDHSSARMFPVDTVLVALVGATIGKTALLKFETSTNQNVLGIRNIKEAGYNPMFVFYYTQFLNDKFQNIGDGGFNMASKGFIGKLPIYDVCIDEQNKFASFAELIDKSKFNVQQHLNLMQELLDKKMDEFFGGKE